MEAEFIESKGSRVSKFEVQLKINQVEEYARNNRCSFAEACKALDIDPEDIED